MNLNLEKYLILAQENGFFELILPLIFIFFALYGGFCYTKLFKKKISLVVSLIISLMIGMMHSLNLFPGCWDIITALSIFIQKLGIVFLLAILTISIVMILKIKVDFLINLKKWVFFAVFSFIILLFLSSRDDFCTSYVEDSLVIWIPLVIIIIGLVISFFSKSKPTKPEDDEDPYGVYRLYDRP